MQIPMRAHLVLEDGTVFAGRSVGAAGVAAGEACFTTAMAGYEQAATDPSYVGQVLCFSFPLVGNYGVDEARLESERVQARGLVMRRARPAWARWLAAQGVVALDGVDTRALVRRLAATGLRVILVPGATSADEILALRPRAVLIGNGPGDPSALDGAIETVRELLGRVPLA